MATSITSRALPSPAEMESGLAPEQAGLIDDIDQRLLEALLAEGRAAVSYLASLLGLSGTATQYRLDRLLKREVVTINGYVDPAFLGRPLNGWLVAASSDPAAVAAAMAQLDQLDFVSWSAEAGTATGHGAFADNSQLLGLMNDQIRSLPDVDQVETVVGLRVHALRPRFWGPRESAAAIDWIRQSTPGSLDDIDLEIARELRSDGRMSFAELARRVDLSAAAVRKRYLRLTEEGSLQVRVYPNPVQLGFAGRGQVNITLAADPRKLIERLIAQPETLYVLETTGAYDLRVALVCRTQAELLKTIEKEVEGQEEVAAFAIEPYSGVAKEYSPPAV